MKVSVLCLGAGGTNCYIITSEKDSAVIIDPACDSAEIISAITEKQVKPKAILLTHGHYDHILAAAALVEKYAIPVYIHCDDNLKLSSITANLYARHSDLEPFCPVSEAKFIVDGDKIIVDELSFEVLFTPGHTGGSVCYRSGEAIFTGDTLFAGSIGRTDFPDGSYAKITESLARLQDLEGDFKIYPGHGKSTTLAYERQHNIFLADFDQI